MVKVCFVCLGNICRSPAAEGIFRTLVMQAGLEQKIYIESAGTGAYHVGELPDSRMRDHASRRGYDLSSRAQRFTGDFFDKFDYIVTMDRSNYNNVLRLAFKPNHHKQVLPFSHLCEKHSINEVPDPYTEGPEGFELVLDLLEDGCQALLERLQDADRKE